MSYIEPNSTIYIFREDDGGSPIPFDPSMENTIYFTDRQNQLQYMMAYNPIVLTKNSYTRISRGVIKIGLDSLNDNAIASLYNANYMAFINESFENKYFYAFVDAVEYLNNNTVTLAFHIDPIQTYMFDWILNQCLIEREHTVTDNYGEHTLPEGLETGRYRSIPASVYLLPVTGRNPETHEPIYDSENPLFMNNRFEYQRCIVLATTLDVNKMATGLGTVDYSYGVVIPGPAGINGGGGEYYSGVRYTTFRINGESQQGIYTVAFSGQFVNGDRILIDDVMSEISLTEPITAAKVAYAVAYNVRNNSVHFTAGYEDNTNYITLYERADYLGYGVPDVQSNSERGSFYVDTVRPGSDGALSEVHKLNNFLYNVASSKYENAIVGIFMMPYEFIAKSEDDVNYGVPQQRIRINFPTSIGDPINGYVPRNKKLFCSPYNELYVTNNAGNEAQYNFEDFSSPESRTNCLFNIWGNLSMNPGMYCAPMFYNGNGYMSGAIDDELILTGFPMCSYAIDSFKAWLSQNAGMIGATAGSLIAGWASAIGTAYATSAAGLMNAGIMSVDPRPAVAGVNPAGYIGQHAMYTPKEAANLNSYMSGRSQNFVGLIGGTLAALGSLYDHSRRPPQSHGANNANLSYQSGQMTFSFYYKQIKKEYAEVIDKFFDMYGYKTNRVGVPNIAARPRYTYVKTIGCSVDGRIPADMRLAIEKIFDKGIRFWTTGAVFGNYDPEVNPNRPVSGGE